MTSKARLCSDILLPQSDILLAQSDIVCDANSDIFSRGLKVEDFCYIGNRLNWLDFSTHYRLVEMTQERNEMTGGRK